MQGSGDKSFYPTTTDWNVSPWKRPPSTRSFPPQSRLLRYPPSLRQKSLMSNNRTMRHCRTRGRRTPLPLVITTTIITLHWLARGNQTMKVKNTVHPRSSTSRRTKYLFEFQTRGLTNLDNRPLLRRYQFPHPLKFSRMDSAPYYPSPPTTSTSSMGEKFFTPGFHWHNRG